MSKSVIVKYSSAINGYFTKSTFFLFQIIAKVLFSRLLSSQYHQSSNNVGENYHLFRLGKGEG